MRDFEIGPGYSLNMKYMKPVNIIVVALAALFLVSCDEEPSIRKKLSFEVTGVVLDEASEEPIENVEIIGFSGGAVHAGNISRYYGEPVHLGTTDKCGQFKITLPDSIKGSSAHGDRDTTSVYLRLTRPDFGEKEVSIPFETGTHTFRVGYAPILEAFFKLLYLVQSEDGKSVNIGWNIYSLGYRYYCPTPMPIVGSLCFDFSDGNLYVQRSDATMHRRIVPVELNNHQIVTDSDLPAGNFDYLIYNGGTGGIRHSHKASIIRTNSDTLFLVKPPAFPVLNHCN